MPLYCILKQQLAHKTMVQKACFLLDHMLFLKVPLIFLIILEDAPQTMIENQSMEKERMITNDNHACKCKFHSAPIIKFHNTCVLM